MKKYTHPPLGVKPKWLHQEIRFKEICEAISRYYNEELKIPLEWVEEYNELIDEINNRNEYKNDRK